MADNMNNNNNMNSNLCKSNCGFFGNASCDGYCSKCYKDHVKRQNSGSAAGRVTPTSMSVASSNSSTSLAAAAMTAAAISQMNSISEIPVNVSSFIQNNNKNSSESSISESDKSSTSQETLSKMLPPLSPPPVTFSLETESDSPSPNSDSKFASSTSSSATTSNSTTTAPIAIPGRLNTQLSHGVAMSVPGDLCSASMTSTGTYADESLIGTSIEMNSSLNATSLSCSSSSSDLGKTKKRSRCVMDDCKRKVGLTGFDCRCGGLYCWEHRYSDKHNCQFDYKELGQDQIRKNNPIVVGEKIQKI